MRRLSSASGIGFSSDSGARFGTYCTPMPHHMQLHV
jgi:hypothetical protein